MTPEKPVPHLSEGEKVEQAADICASNLYTKADTKSYSIHKIYKDGFITGAQWQERQSTQMYTAEQCLAMLSALRQRCAEEAPDTPWGLYQDIQAIDVRQFIPTNK